MMAEISESQKQHLTQVQTQSSSQQQSQLAQQPQQSQQISETSNQLALTIRLLMQGKEVGSIIGKKGDNIKRFREVSGAKINVSDSSCLDRIVTLAGTLDEVYNAFSMICSKFEEQILQVNSSSGSITTTSASPLSNTSAGNNLLLGNPAASVIDPLFGLPSASILTSALKESSLAVKEADMLTMNNNSTNTINNNNIGAPNKNLTSNNNKHNSTNNAYHPLVTLRLIIPASQCGSLIGRGGAKIKEIRELTGAAIQVAPDVLPNSTERVVTISGNVESLRSCAYQICIIMVESPPKGYTIPYRPKPALNPMLLAAATAGQAAAAYNLPGQFALSAHPDVNRLFVANNPLAAAFNPTANLRAAAASGQAAAALSAVASQSISSQEMVIPNGLIGCVIGKGGSKINEIRQLSGATIKISNSEEGTKNRTVTINGAPEAINLAQYLITASCNGHQTSLLENITKPSIANKSAQTSSYTCTSTPTTSKEPEIEKLSSNSFQNENGNSNLNHHYIVMLKKRRHHEKHLTDDASKLFDLKNFPINYHHSIVIVPVQDTKFWIFSYGSDLCKNTLRNQHLYTELVLINDKRTVS